MLQFCSHSAVYRQKIKGYFIESSKRAAFVNKKIIAALTESRESALVQQQENQENLIHSIFPPMVADLLIENKSQMGFGNFGTMSTCSSGLMGNKTIGKAVSHEKERNLSFSILLTLEVCLIPDSLLASTPASPLPMHFDPRWPTCMRRSAFSLPTLLASQR